MKNSAGLESARRRIISLDILRGLVIVIMVLDHVRDFLYIDAAARAMTLDPQVLNTSGFSLPVVYVTWMAIVAMLYPLCRWFAGVKQRRREWWLSYL